MTSSTETKPKPAKTTKAAWKKKATHEDVVLPSGAVVDIKLPNLAQLLKAGSIPNDLVNAAIQFENAREVTREIIEEGWEFMQWIIPRTVVKPEGITEEDVGDLPPEDLDKLAQFIGRTDDIDAVGNHLGGLHTSAEWRKFRGVVSIDEIAAELEGSG